MAAIQFDTRLGELGGQRMLKRGVGDDRDEAGALKIFPFYGFHVFLVLGFW